MYISSPPVINDLFQGSLQKMNTNGVRLIIVIVRAPKQDSAPNSVLKLS